MNQKTIQIILILSFFSLTRLYGQQYDTRFIIEKADNILKITLGDSLYKYFEYDSDSYYEYTTKSGKTKWRTLIKKKKTKGNFVSTDVRFNFLYPQIKEIRGNTQVKFDKHLNLIDSIYLDFIPKFLLENRKCNFINKSEALEIAKDSISKKGIYDLSVRLNFDVMRKTYVYVISNILSERLNLAGYKHGDIEVVEVNAVSGKIINSQIMRYGVVH